MGEFNPHEDLRVEVTPRDDVFDLRSRGMVDIGRQELCIRSVPESQVRNAGVLINQAAGYIADSPVSSGERMGIELSSHMPIVTIFDAGPDLQRIADGHVEASGASLPRVALSTVALERAHQAFARDDRATGLTILDDSIQFYPGDTLADAEPFFGYPYNWQNCLTYRELSRQYAEETGAGFLRDACERSVILQSQVLGAPIEFFRSLDADMIARRAAYIHRKNVETYHVEDGPNEALVITISPLWTLGAEDTVHRTLAMVPKKLLQLYWNRDVVEAVDSAPVYELVGEAIEAFGDDPVGLAAKVTDSRRLWTDPSAPAKNFEDEYVNGDVLLSSLLAHIARLTAGGAELPVLRASLGLSDDSTALADLRDIEQKLQEMEASAYGAAMQRQQD